MYININSFLRDNSIHAILPFNLTLYNKYAVYFKDIFSYLMISWYSFICHNLFKQYNFLLESVLPSVLYMDYHL